MLSFIPSNSNKLSKKWCELRSVWNYFHTLKKIGFVRNLQKRFRRFEKDCKWVKTSKKQVFNSTEPLKVLPADTREEPFSEKPFFFVTKLKKVPNKKLKTFRASYQTIKGFVQNHIFVNFITKPSDGSIRSSKGFEFLIRNLFKFRNEKKRFFRKRFGRIENLFFWRFDSFTIFFKPTEPFFEVSYKTYFFRVYYQWKFNPILFHI